MELRLRLQNLSASKSTDYVLVIFLLGLYIIIRPYEMKELQVNLLVLNALFYFKANLYDRWYTLHRTENVFILLRFLFFVIISRLSSPVRNFKHT